MPNDQSFLSDPLRFKLNHFFLPDLSFPSEPPSSLGLSAFVSSPRTLLLLPLPMPMPPLKLLKPTVLFTVNALWMLSRCFSSSSTYTQEWISMNSFINLIHCMFSCRSQIKSNNGFLTTYRLLLFTIFIGNFLKPRQCLQITISIICDLRQATLENTI